MDIMQMRGDAMPVVRGYSIDQTTIEHQFVIDPTIGTETVVGSFVKTETVVETIETETVVGSFPCHKPALQMLPDQSPLSPVTEEDIELLAEISTGMEVPDPISREATPESGDEELKPHDEPVPEETVEQKESSTSEHVEFTFTLGGCKVTESGPEEPPQVSTRPSLSQPVSFSEHVSFTLGGQSVSNVPDVDIPTIPGDGLEDVQTFPGPAPTSLTLGGVQADQVSASRPTTPLVKNTSVPDWKPATPRRTTTMDVPPECES